MKKFLQWVMEWKTAACLMFTATVLLYLLACPFLGETAISTSLLWSFLLISAIGTLIQWLCYTDRIIRKMGYTRRSMLFCLLFFPLLALLAWVFQWFSITVGGCLLFTGIFVSIFVAMMIGFEIYFRVTGRKYDGLLGQYRRQRENEKESE